MSEILEYFDKHLDSVQENHQEDFNANDHFGHEFTDDYEDCASSINIDEASLNEIEEVQADYEDCAIGERSRENDTVIESKEAYEDYSDCGKESTIEHDELEQLPEGNSEILSHLEREIDELEIKAAEKFERLHALEYKSDEYNQILKDYNDLREYKEKLSTSIVGIRTKQELLEKSALESKRDIDKRLEDHNLNPRQDIAIAFEYVDSIYERTSVHWQETANRLLESLKNEQADIKSLLGKTKEANSNAYEALSNYVMSKNLDRDSAKNDATYWTLNDNYITSKKEFDTLNERDQICRIKIEEVSKKIIPEMQTNYMGMNGLDFQRSYDSYITNQQGKAHPDFGGNCGIIESCNLVNQQTGSSLSELDGIQEFVTKGLCVTDRDYSKNGGTDVADREAFLTDKGLTFDRIEGPYQNKDSVILLDKIAERFHSGESAGLMLKSEDLSQLQLAKEDSLFNPRFANHATTIAGFSYNVAGEVTGVWINDTGGWAGSNRVFIDKDKFNLMQNETKGFAIEFSRKVVK